MDNIAPISAQIEVSSKSVISAIFQRWLNLLATKLNLIVDGEYTPTMVAYGLNPPTNIEPVRFRYTRVGNNVHVFGEFTCVTKGSSTQDLSFQIYMEPPIGFNKITSVIAGSGGDFYSLDVNASSNIFVFKINEEVETENKIVISGKNAYRFTIPVRCFINFSYNIN